MAVTINASTTNGLIQTADTTGNLSLQSNGTTIAALTSTGLAVTGAGNFSTTLGVTGVSTLTAGAVIQGMTVGLGAGAISTNTAVGASALAATNTNTYQVAVGYQALQSNTSGGQNTAVGGQTLTLNTTSASNVAVGFQALQLNTAADNTAVGTYALNINTSGASNVAVGKQALAANTSGSNNTALSPINSAGAYAPVFDPTTQSNRFCMGSTGVTNAYIQVAWTVVSDARDKTDFAPVPHGLDFVSKLKPTSYRYKMSREDTEGHGPIRYGFKAQDVLALEGIDPVIVDAEDAEKLRFNDQSMIAVLVNAIQELTAKVTALEAK